MTWICYKGTSVLKVDKTGPKIFRSVLKKFSEPSEKVFRAFWKRPFSYHCCCFNWAFQAAFSFKVFWHNLSLEVLFESFELEDTVFTKDFSEKLKRESFDIDFFLLSFVSLVIVSSMKKIFSGRLKTESWISSIFCPLCLCYLLAQWACVWRPIENIFLWGFSFVKFV